jgi:hypothetical protein
MENNDNNIDGQLKPFCAKKRDGYLKEPLQHPFSFKGYTYATDGRVLIRVKRQTDIPTPAPRSKLRQTAKAAEAYFSKFPVRGFRSIKIPANKTVPATSDWGIKRRIVAIGNRNFDMRFLSAMKHLPDLKVRIRKSSRPLPKECDGVEPGARRGTIPLEFLFNGGCGLLMPTLTKAGKRIA